MKIIENTILASSSSLEGIRKLIASYWFDSIERIVLTPISNNEWGISKINPQKDLPNFKVFYDKEKYSFEHI
jgi:hypothetical protein